MGAESPIVRCILDTLNELELAHVWRNQSGTVRVKRGFMHLAPKGSPDIVGFVLDGSGRFLGIEVKQPGEKPTPEQLAWLQNIREAGGVAAWASSADEAVAFVRAAMRVAA